MPDDLRTRIAAAIRAVDDMRVCKLSDADIKFIVEAVIRELNLTQEWSIGNEDDGRVIWDNQQEATDYEWRKDEPLQTRHVTTWETVE